MTKVRFLFSRDWIIIFAKFIEDLALQAISASSAYSSYNDDNNSHHDINDDFNHNFNYDFNTTTIAPSR
jgi:hypothetical protein